MQYWTSALSESIRINKTRFSRLYDDLYQWQKEVVEQWLYMPVSWLLRHTPSHHANLLNVYTIICGLQQTSSRSSSIAWCSSPKKRSSTRTWKKKHIRGGLTKKMSLFIWNEELLLVMCTSSWQKAETISRGLFVMCSSISAPPSSMHDVSKVGLKLDSFSLCRFALIWLNWVITLCSQQY